MRLCKCGCGGEIKNDKWDYLRGHKPKAAGADDGVATEAASDDVASFELSLTMTAEQIDAVWATLTPLQKANGLVAALQS